MADQRRAAFARSLPFHTLRWGAAVLALALGVQIARLLLAVLTAQGPLGIPAAQQSHASAEAVARRFDPFFRSSGPESASGIVTGLPIKLFGTRVDFATGQGSAIIAAPDGVQSSFVVGEAVMPGAKLVGVARDHVDIDRGGVREKLYLDQSVPTPAAPALPVAAPVQNSAAPAESPPVANEASSQ